jgi:hypothetical protein
MHRHVLAAFTAISVVLALGTGIAGADIKIAPYPEVKVKVFEPYQGDAAFTAMRKAFGDAVTKKDSSVLFGLVGPSFAWTQADVLVEGDFDLGRDALHNFKVVFGFREPGKDVDGGVENGPFWGLLAGFAKDPTAYERSQNLVCTPTSAEFVDESVFEQADNKLANGDETVDWFFTLGETPVSKGPADNGPPIGKLGTIAVPMLSAHPPTPDDSPVAVPATHYEVLMPNGRVGWIPAAAARPLTTGFLCFAKTTSGEWKIVRYEEPAQNQNQAVQQPNQD